MINKLSPIELSSLYYETECILFGSEQDKCILDFRGSAIINIFQLFRFTLHSPKLFLNIGMSKFTLILWFIFLKNTLILINVE